HVSFSTILDGPMATYQAPRGMRDLLPAEATGFDRLFAAVMARARRYGYARIVTPIAEDRDVFLRTSGQSSDAAGKEMYEVWLHGQGGLGLRPEGTASVARAYLEHGLHRAPQPVRLSYWDPMFRGQRPQKLRFRQFWQWGLECFGAPEPAADVEIIEFTVGLLAELGLTDYVLKVNTLGGAESRAHVKAALTGSFERSREDLDADSKAPPGTSGLRTIASKVPPPREVADGAPTA